MLPPTGDMPERAGRKIGKSGLLPRLTTLLAVLAVLAASCAGPSDDGGATPETATTEAGATPTSLASPITNTPSPQFPGEGVSVTMGRGNWSSAYFQAAVYRELLALLGYEVNDPADKELAPRLAYLAMAEGDIDLWTNATDPLHNNWFVNELPDGSVVGDHVEKVGKVLDNGILQGFLMTKVFAEEFGIATLDDLENNPDAIAAYDSDDYSPGDGVVDIFGCEESWTCDDLIENILAFSGYRNIRQVKAGYDAMFAEARARAEAGDPMVIYSWTPTYYLAYLRPGDNVIWVGVEEVLDDSNPLGLEGGEAMDQRPGVADIEAESCPAAVTLGECRLGFQVASDVVAVRKEFLEKNPAAKRLFEVATLNPVDVTLRILEEKETDVLSADLARQWIIDNQERVDAWLEEARAAA